MNNKENFQKSDENYFETDDFYGSNTKNNNEFDSLSSRKKIPTIDKKLKDNDSFANPKRDLSALSIIIRFIIFLIIIITFIVLIKIGINVYQDDREYSFKKNIDSSPILKEVILTKDFDYDTKTNGPSFFEKQINIWNLSNRHLQTAIDYKRQSGNYDDAINQCYESLEINPGNIKSLKLLIELYDPKEDQIKIINTLLRILSINFDQPNIHRKLINTLFDINDFDSASILSEFYHNRYEFNEDVSRIHAISLKEKKMYNESLLLLDKLIKNNPNNVNYLDTKIDIYMKLKKYKDALPLFEKSYYNNYDNKIFYYNYSYCNAQTLNTNKTIEILNQAANRFGLIEINKWIQDPVYHQFYTNKLFSSFINRLSRTQLDESIGRENSTNTEQKGININLDQDSINYSEAFNLLEK